MRSESTGIPTLRFGYLTLVKNKYSSRHSCLNIVSNLIRSFPEKLSQPNFVTITVEYVPDQHTAELRSLNFHRPPTETLKFITSREPLACFI